MKRNYNNLSHKLNIDNSKYKYLNFKKLHLSLDTEDDLKLLREIFKHFNNSKFNIIDVLDYLNNKNKQTDNI